MYRPTTSSSSTGFTLVEILVALAVIAIALTAVMQNFGQNIDTTVALRERTVGLWVAQNRLVQHYVLRDWPSPETVEGTAEMAGGTWRWREEVSSTPDEEIRRIVVEVRVAPNREAAARVTGFLAKPAAATVP